MSENRTQRSFHDDDAVRDDPHVPEYPHGVGAGHAEAAYETSDLGLKILAWAAAIVGGLVVVVLIAVRLLTSLYYQSPDSQPQGGSAVEPAAPPPAVEMRVNPLAAWQKYQAESDAQLSGYGWVDQNAGVARVPITRAMALLLDGVQPALTGDGADAGSTGGATGTPTPAP